MKRLANTLLILALGSFLNLAQAEMPRVQMETSMGNITLELNAEKAPATVKNFLQYVTEGKYEGTIFHRVIGNFMIQGGGFTPDFKRVETFAAIMNEADNGLSNSIGSIAMARTSDPHSASNQFFINVADNTFLNHSSKTPRGWGYAVFGKVVKGMSVVNKIRSVQTGAAGPFRSDVPRNTVVIKKMTLLNPAPAAKPAAK